MLLFLVHSVCTLLFHTYIYTDTSTTIPQGYLYGYINYDTPGIFIRIHQLRYPREALQFFAYARPCSNGRYNI